MGRIEVASLVLFPERLHNPVGFLVYDVAPVYNLLSFLHHSTGQRHAVEQFVERGRAPFLVIDDVRYDIVRQIAALQRGLVGYQQRVVEQTLVGILGRMELFERYAGGLFAIDDTDGAGCVITRQFAVILSCHDTLQVEPSQSVGDDADIVIRQSVDAIAEMVDKLPGLLCLHLGGVAEVRLKIFVEAVTFLLHGCFRLVDGKVEGSRQVAIFPGLPQVGVEIVACIPGHTPDDDRHRTDDDGSSDENVFPGDFFGQIQKSHILFMLRLTLCFCMRKYVKKMTNQTNSCRK